MEPVQGSTSGHMQLDYLKTQQTYPPVRALVVEHLLQVLWALTTTVSQHIVVLCGTLLFSTIMTHCGMDKIVMDLSVHAVILQTSRGSARSFLSQLLMTWNSVSVWMSLVTPMKIFPLTLLNSTYSEPCDIYCVQLMM